MIHFWIKVYQSVSKCMYVITHNVHQLVFKENKLAKLDKLK